MDITRFSESEKHALLDLLVLGMYADGHLAAAEDSRIQRLLDAMALTSDDARQKAVDASVTKVRRLGASPASARGAVADLAKEFSKPELRRLACDALEDMLASDDQVAGREREFLCIVRDVFAS